MKALVLERKGSKAILLLSGGEMRTVRASKGWETGMEVDVKPYPLPRKKKAVNLRAVFYPAAACAAVCLIAWIGLSQLGGDHIDRQHPIQPLSSGQPVQTQPPEESALPMPTPSPMAVRPTPEPSAEAETDLPVNIPQPTPMKKEWCDECGEYGHDDDDCPYERCDKCGESGHDDDDCPKQTCEECGRAGHDDDDCPDRACDECGRKGHDDDDCPYEHDGEHHSD